MPIGPLPQQVYHVNKSISANQTPTTEKSLIGLRKSTKKYSKFGESNEVTGSGFLCLRIRLLCVS